MKTTSHIERVRDAEEGVGRLLAQQDVVVLRPASGPVTARGIEMSLRAWNKVRRLAKANGFSLSDDRTTITPTEGGQFATALRQASPTTASLRELVTTLVTMLHTGRGLHVSRKQA